MTARQHWRRLKRRLDYFLNRGERQRLLWEELESHIESLAQDFAREGMSENEARLAARRRFGNMTQNWEDSRCTWIARWISDLAQDLRYAFRNMRRNLGFTAFTILIAGLGIGASSTIFSVVNALLLRPLPFKDPARLVWITNGNDFTSTQTEHYSDLREQNRSFADLAAFADWGVGNRQLTGTGEPERLTSVPVTQNFFALLGMQPQLGRWFTAEESRDRYLNPRATVLSYNFWQRRFASDPGVIGRKLILDNQPVKVVGVLPKSFDFGSVFAPGTQVDIFVPWPLLDPAKPQGNTLRIVGRLKPGTTVGAARAEMAALAKQLERQHPERNGVTPLLVPLPQHVSQSERPALFVLMCAVGAVMLIVCANLSNLQLARLNTRQKEIATRTALGAGRSRLLRQMIAESVALSCCGAVLGLFLAFAGVHEIAHRNTFNLPLLETVRMDGRAFGFTLFAAVAAGILFGILPALQVSSASLSENLESASRGSSANRRHAWVRETLVVSEVAFACTLLIGAGLLMRSFVRVLDVKLGFRPERAAALRIDPSFRISELAKQNAFIDDALRRVRSIPGITAAGLSDVLPLRDDRSWSVSVKGRVHGKSDHPEPYIRVVTDGYFQAAGISLRAGRLLTDRDRAAATPVVIINQTMARTAWPSQNPLGQTLTTYSGDRVLGTVVGIVEDVRHVSLETASGPEIYLAMRQTRDYGAMQLVMRSALPIESLATAIRTALRPLDPNLPVRDFQPFQELVEKAVSPRRFLLLLLAGFAAFALVLASLGIYAVIAYSVNQRVQEFGIRMALGASSTDLQSGIVLRTLLLAAWGLAIGLVASRALASGLGALLYDVTSGDPYTFAGIAVLLIAVAALAGYIPARKASRIDPMTALRTN
jgi:predicted permease